MQTYHVTVKKGVDTEELCHELEHDTTNVNCGCPIDRPVECYDRRETSLRTTDYVLTEEEAQILKADPRILDVELPPTQDDIALDGVLSYDFSRGPDDNHSRSDLSNWALRRCTPDGINDSPAASGANLSTNISNSYPMFGSDGIGDNHTFVTDHKYNIDGTGVDVVIQDNGVMPNHPEWLDENGVSRFNEINWYAAASISGSMPANFYKSEGAHGTHVGATVAGRTYGWAKNAQIYSMRMIGNDRIDILTSFDLIRLWHQRKPIDPKTGYRRPTIVNASWGYARAYPNGGVYQSFAELNYLGQNRPEFVNNALRDMTLAQRNAVGISALTEVYYEDYNFNYTGFRPRYQLRYSSSDAAVEDLTDAGVIFVKAAGNYFGTIYRDTDPEWNNYFTVRDSSGDISPRVYYHRGSSPQSDNVIVVANSERAMDGNKEQLNMCSEKGPRVDICAPGTGITSATDPNGYGSGKTVPYPLNNSFNIARITGTSMAAPQVSGVLALYMQLNPQATAQECKNWLTENAQTNIMKVTAHNNYGDLNGTRGAPDRFLINPYSSNTRTVIKQK